MSQSKNITELKTYNAWQKGGVNVNKGAKALYVLSPLPMCKEHGIASKCGSNKCVDTYMKYKKQPLFDAKQTNLKEEEINKIVEENFQNKIKNPEFNYLVEYLQSIKPFALNYSLSEKGEAGYTDGKKINISVDSDPDLKNQTLLHEFGHIYLEHNTDNLGYEGHIRGVKETQAEMFAWVSEKMLGIENEKTKKIASNYINSWTKETKDMNPMKEFNKVFNSVNKVFNKPTIEQQKEIVSDWNKNKEQVKELFNDKKTLNVDKTRNLNIEFLNKKEEKKINR
ncbi:hypothetical protein STABA_v1c00820 [Spiroplasma tabanidicola]|uniref:IrrE N-terminal-like domain-containing protein n=4 Tax=Spiroplasma tabanidicola TaxID=324079 RepID=A0A6I6C7P1_9MOLU|nr:hypothetical protein STABA_v1c00820 [Spiroplasma tabanidicola]